ncbi:MAG: WYL domain-containing protein [Phycicoccus sp.]|nr:WYL domain-containing protein [Phycicoccus sp.]
MPSPSPATKTERLLNLVLVLLYTTRPLTRAQIRAAVPQYGDTASDEAFQRMFERDKDELRELGIPLVTEVIGTNWVDEEGYRIHQRDYALPDITFEPDEMAVLGLAARTWAAASLAGPAAQALRKLRAGEVERDTESLIGIEPRLRAVEPAFDDVRHAVTSRRVITFDYRRPEAIDAATRRVQPWSLLSWHGHWYLTAFDLDRQAPRVFRLSRIQGRVRAQRAAGAYTVPAHDAREMVSGSVAVHPTRTAAVRVRQGRGQALRRQALEVDSLDSEWDQIALGYADTAGLASELAAYGPDVVAVSPPDVVAQVREMLAAVAHPRVIEGSDGGRPR